MFCIAAFIIFIILGIFSARYRKLAGKAWSCVIKKVTLKPCEIGFKEEAKNALIGKLIITHPRLAKFLDRWIELFATIFVVLSIWSLLVVFQAGLNLLVYDTCYPKNVESCSLGGEACGISAGGQSFWSALKKAELLTWMKDETLFLADTVSRVPDRFKTWVPEEYLSGTESYFYPYDSEKKVALEIIDPGCKYCAKLWDNIKSVGFEKKYNLTYIPYAIPDSKAQSGYKFPNSPLVISYLEATKVLPKSENAVPADWRILDKLFSGKDSDGVSFQKKFNLVYSKAEAESVLQKWLGEIGYDSEEIQKLQLLSRSEKVKERVKKQIKTVEENIRTLKIPTIIFDGRRYDRVVGPEKLK